MEHVSTQTDDEDARSLPTNRAFVLQFRQSADIQGGCVDGRIEHITSGRAEVFHTLDELVRFVGENLAGHGGPLPSESFDQED